MISKFACCINGREGRGGEGKVGEGGKGRERRGWPPNGNSWIRPCV